MHPQSELENYKLQVELLQEKLHRSEDNRQELEEKLEQIMKKRNEHERTLRSRSQLRHQQLLNEQKKRNERNRKLVEMLEQIDHQAAALSARSERLKMMKLQYELYFSKLVQSYAIKTLESFPAFPARSIKSPCNKNTTLRPNVEIVSTGGWRMPFINTHPLKTAILNEQNLCQPNYTFGCAPPGILIALPNNTSSIAKGTDENKKIQSNFCFDYSQYPIGYLQEATSIPPMRYNIGQVSYLQNTHHKQEPSIERQTQTLFTADDEIKQSNPHFELRIETPSPFPYADVETNPNETQSNQPIYERRVCGAKPVSKKYDDVELNKEKKDGQESQNLMHNLVPISSKDLLDPHQSLKVDELPNIKQSNSFRQKQNEEGVQIAHDGNKRNTIDFLTDNKYSYIKSIREMEQTYEKNVPLPINLTSQGLSIDYTTLQIPKKGKIDETNIRDGVQINAIDDNEKNTSSASSAPLDGKCSIESVGDEDSTFVKKPLEYKTETPVRNIDPSRDSEQITLFNAKQNSKDKSTRASNRIAAIIDGDEGKNKENPENTHMDLNTKLNSNIYRAPHIDEEEKMSIENIETAFYGELLTKPTKSTLSGDVLQSDNLKENIEGNKEIERNSQQTEGYECTNLEQVSYEQEFLMGENHEQVAPYATEIEKTEAKHDVLIENSQESYLYNDVGSVEEQQQYDKQNYNYSDPSITPIVEDVIQQQYSVNEDGQYSQGGNYSTDYPNFDATQYQGEYGSSEYQYDYSQPQYDDTNDPQYAPEYTQDYAQYEEVAFIAGETSNQALTEEPYLEANQQIADSEENYIPGHEVSSSEQNEKQILEKPDEEFHEEETRKILSHPSSILSTDKNNDLTTKKKKRVNFVDSETDDNSTQQKQGGASSESDFDFSTN